MVSTVCVVSGQHSSSSSPLRDHHHSASYAKGPSTVVEAVGHTESRPWQPARTGQALCVGLARSVSIHRQAHRFGWER